MSIPSPLKQYHFQGILIWWHKSRGLYFGPKTIFIPPPFWKWYFFPLLWHVIFRLPSWPFYLNSSLFCNYFTLLLPLFSFSFPFLPFTFPFLSPFFLFLLHFPYFSLRLFIFFPPNDIAWYLPPQGGGEGGIFPVFTVQINEVFLSLNVVSVPTCLLIFCSPGILQN